MHAGWVSCKKRTSLLIVRTAWGFSLPIFILVTQKIDEYQPRYAEFPAYSRVFLRRYQRRSQQIYDLVPIRSFVFGACPLAVGTATSDAPPFRGLTGGVYKAQEHIHRGVADPRLLAIPASRRRVAACDLNWGVFSGIGSRLRVGIPLFTPL